mgnify:CR=1 FL=1
MTDLRLLALDVDGVLTDGTFLLHGETGEWKAFHAADGFGLRCLIDQGVKVVFVTGRDSPIVERRGRELGVHAILQGRRDKREALEELKRELGITAEQCAYMGDDLVDLPAMLACGLSAAPADARPEVRAAARWVAPSNGGRGAVRDYCEHLLRLMGVWEGIRKRFMG